MTTHPFDTLVLDDGTAVILTPCPGTRGTGLRDSLKQLAQAGAKAVITLMPTEEMARNGVAEMPAMRREPGLHWFHLPIEDDAAPGRPFREAWARDKAQVLALLDRHDAPAVHCRGGSGRTGLMTAILLLERGMAYDEAVAAVRRMRPKALQIGAHLDCLENWKQ